MEAELRDQFARRRLGRRQVVMQRAGDLRYVGQGYELNVEFPAGPLDRRGARGGVAGVPRSSTAAEYGHAFQASPIEIVNDQAVTGVGAMPKLDRLTRRSRASGAAEPVGTGQLRVPGRRRSSARYETPFYRRDDLPGASASRAGDRAAAGQHHRRAAGLALHADGFGNILMEHAWEPQRPRGDDRRHEHPRRSMSPAAVIHGALENIAIEMGHKLMRMSYSSIIRESEDFGAALTDAEGRQLCECKMSTPLQSGPIPGYIERHPQRTRWPRAARARPAT